MVKKKELLFMLLFFFTAFLVTMVHAGPYEGEEKVVQQEGKAESSGETPCMPPKITYLVTDYGMPGDTIRIKGRRFGLEKGTVTFNGIQAEVLTWRMETIYVKVPEKAKTGPVIVNNGCDNSNGVIFTVGSSPEGEQRGTTW
jgi:hypothetical protein